MELHITTNEGTPLATVSEDYELEILPDGREYEEAFESLVASVRTGDTDTPDDETELTGLAGPPERKTAYPPFIGFTRLKHYLPHYGPIQATIEGEVSKAKDTSPGPTHIELEESYRVWVKAPEAAPSNVDVVHDPDGPGTSTYYYDAPFTTTIPLESADEDASTAPSRTELIALGVPHTDLRVRDQSINLVQKGELTPSRVRLIESPLTLLHLYKAFYDAGRDRDAGVVKHEMEARGIDAIQRLEKGRRYITNPSDAPEGRQVQVGERGGIYYETDVDDSGLEDFESTSVTQTRPQSEWRDEYPDSLDAEIIEAFDAVPFIDVPREGWEGKVREYLAETFVRCRKPSIIKHALKTLEHISDNAPGAAYRDTTQTIRYNHIAPQSTVVHEFGHALAGTYGYSLEPKSATIYAHFHQGDPPVFHFGEEYVDVAQKLLKDVTRSDLYQPLVDQLEEDYSGVVMEKEHFLLEKYPDAPEHTPVDRLVEEVNKAWLRMAESTTDPDKDPEDYYFHRPYAMVNAHETLSNIHEAMQGPMAHYDSMETLYLRHPALLDAYLELFDLPEQHAEMLSKVYKDHGPNGYFTDDPTTKY